MKPEILFRCFVEHGSEDAFRELVSDTLPLVYSTALRILDGSAPLSESVAHDVFRDLGTNTTRSRQPPNLLLWLYDRTFTNARALARKQGRLPTAVARGLDLDSPDSLTPENLHAVSRYVDGAVARLKVKDRESLVDHFLVTASSNHKAEAPNPPQPASTQLLAHLSRSLRRLGIRADSSVLPLILEARAGCEVPAGLSVRISQSVLLNLARPRGLWALFAPNWLKHAYAALVFLTTVVVLCWPTPRPKPQPSGPPSTTHLTPLQWAQLGTSEDAEGVTVVGGGASSQLSNSTATTPK